MKLSLGTAQFGSDYGIANQGGQISLREAQNILRIAESVGMTTLDTAISYGSAEEMLGKIGVDNFECVSKLPQLPKNIDNVKSWVKSQIIESIDRLGVSYLCGILLHYPEDLLGENSDEYRIALMDAKDLGYVKNIGFSIYSPNILNELTRVFWPDIVQVPYNVFDQRINSSGWLRKLLARETKIHARSVFLQGLLLMEPDTRPTYFDNWRQDFAKWDELVNARKISHMEYALNFVMVDKNIDRVIVGVDSALQLLELIRASQIDPGSNLQSLDVDDLSLIDPSLWRLK